MHRLRILFLLPAIIVFVACASSPVQERPPKHLRQSTRHLNKGARLYAKGCFPQALGQFRKAHERYAAADHLPGTAASLNSLANTYYRMDEPKLALAVYDEAIDIFRSLGDQSGRVRAMTNKAAVLIELGQLDAADAVLGQADNLAERQRLLTSLRLKVRGILLMRRNDIPAAEIKLKQALDAAPKSTGSRFSTLHYGMGRLLLTAGRPAEALPYFSAALEADQDIGAYHGIAQDLAAIGDSQADLEQHDQAVFAYKRSLKLYALLGDASRVASIRSRLETSARSAGVDIDAVLLWAAKWLAGEREANICR